MVSNPRIYSLVCKLSFSSLINSQLLYHFVERFCCKFFCTIEVLHIGFKPKISSKKEKQNKTKHVYDFCFSSWYSQRSKVHLHIMTSSMELEGSLEWLAPLLPWEKANQGNPIFPMITPKTNILNSNSTSKQWTRATP